MLEKKAGQQCSWFRNPECVFIVTNTPQGVFIAVQNVTKHLQKEFFKAYWIKFVQLKEENRKNITFMFLALWTTSYMSFQYCKSLQKFVGQILRVPIIFSKPPGGQYENKKNYSLKFVWRKLGLSNYPVSFNSRNTWGVSTLVKVIFY